LKAYPEKAEDWRERGCRREVGATMKGGDSEVTKLGIMAFLVAAAAMASGAAAGVLVTTSLVGPTSVVVGEEAAWDITIQVTTDVDIAGVTVKDGMGADLDEIVVGTPSIGVAEAAKMGKGKMGATMVT
jgi:hypothetical protein